MGWPDADLLKVIIVDAMLQSGLWVVSLPPYLRERQRGDFQIFTHYGDAPIDIPSEFEGEFEGEFVLGQCRLAACEVAILRKNNHD